MTNDIEKMIDNLEFISKQESATIEINQNGCKLLLDYITNLQEEVNKLTAESTEWEERTYCWQDRAEDLQIRIDKAIELLKEAGCYDEETKTFCDDVWEELPKLLNILQGEDKK